MNATRSRRLNEWVVLLVALFFYPCSGFAQGDEAEIPDSGLVAALRVALEIPDAPITIADLGELEILDAAGGEIRDLTGLEHAVNLRVLDLSDNRICKLDPIESLTEIEELDISRNPIGDLTMLARPSLRVFRASGIGMVQIVASFPNAEVIDLSENLFFNLPPIVSLSPNVRDLNLSGNVIADLTPVSELDELESLDLSMNPLTDLDEQIFFFGTQITHLSLAGTPISDLSVLEDFTALQSLDLTDVPATDISSLEGLNQLGELSLAGMFLDLSDGSAPSAVIDALLAGGAVVDTSRQRSVEIIEIPDEELRQRLISRDSNGVLTTLDMARFGVLYLDDERIVDLTGIELAYNVRLLDIEENELEDIAPVAALTGLVSLDACDNRIGDISPVAGLTRLKQLDLEENLIRDLSPVVELNDLVILSVEENQIRDLAPIRSHSMLMALRADYNPLGDIEAVRDVFSLRTLDVSSTGIDSIEPVSGLHCLERLFFSENAVTSLEPLRDLEHLDTIIARSNELRDISPLEGRLGRIFLSHSFLDLGAGSEARRVIDGLLQAGQDIQFEPQLPDGRVVHLPLQIRSTDPRFYYVRFPTEAGKFYQVRLSIDLQHWQRSAVVLGSGSDVEAFLLGSPWWEQNFMEVVQFEEL